MRYPSDPVLLMANEIANMASHMDFEKNNLESDVEKLVVIAVIEQLHDIAMRLAGNKVDLIYSQT